MNQNLSYNPGGNKSTPLAGFFIRFRLGRGFQGGRALALLMAITFFSRLILGVFVTTALPHIGFDTETENAGYLYSDAYRRDLHSLALAQSDAPLVTSFSNDAGADQYGGLMFLTAAIYRLFDLQSPHPLLFTILAAFAMTGGLAFLMDALRRRWGNRIALAAGWFFALYPEGVLLGSSQMREPFLIGLFCVAFWAVVTWKEKTRKKILLFLLSAALSLAFSLPFGAILIGLLVAYGLVEWIVIHPSQRVKRFGLLALVALGVVGFIGGWLWLKPTLYYDAFITAPVPETSQYYWNGWVRNGRCRLSLSMELPNPFFRRVDGSLSAILAYHVLVRALGWWLMLPFLPYGLFALWKARSKSDRWVLLLIVVALIGWTLISALRAGGDMWDNPRYRALLIPGSDCFLAGAGSASRKAILVGSCVGWELNWSFSGFPLLVLFPIPDYQELHRVFPDDSGDPRRGGSHPPFRISIGFSQTAQ